MEFARKSAVADAEPLIEPNGGKNTQLPSRAGNIPQQLRPAMLNKSLKVKKLSQNHEF